MDKIIKKSILVVEDDLYMNETLCELLETENFNIDSASTINDALNKLNNNNYDVLILDYNLADKNGLTGLDVYKAGKEKNSDVNAIMISAYGSKKIKESALEKGINIFLDKPFLITELLKALHK